MFLVELYNVGNSRQFETFAEAEAWARKSGFEAAISLHGMQIATYSPISGFRKNPAYY